MKNNKILLGAHMSIAGGLNKAIERGDSIGCTAIQIFTHSNRQWHVPTLSLETISLFKEAKKLSAISIIMAHSSYLLNIGSSNPELRKKSIQTLMQELKQCEELEIPYLVMHPGAAVGGSKEDTIKRISESLDHTYDYISGQTMILLENMAGQGSVIGTTFEELYLIRQSSHHQNRIGYCFDTCHAFAAGYDLSTEKGYLQTWQLFDDILNLKNLKAMHLNDSKMKLSSHVDRHEHIGKGALGIQPFEWIMNDKNFATIPKVIETPKGEDSLQEDAQNLELLKRLIKRVS